MGTFILGVIGGSISGALLALMVWALFRVAKRTEEQASVLQEDPVSQEIPVSQQASSQTHFIDSVGTPAPTQSWEELARILASNGEQYERTERRKSELKTLTGTLRVVHELLQHYIQSTELGSNYAVGSGLSVAEKAQVETLFTAGIWLAGKRGVAQANIAECFARQLAMQFRVPPEPKKDVH